MRFCLIMVLTVLVRVSVSSFFLGCIPIFVLLLCNISSPVLYVVKDYWEIIFVAYFCVLNIILLIVFKGLNYQVAIRAAGLGIVFTLGITLSWYGTIWRFFGWYMTVLSFFHFSEYFVTACINPHNVNLDSFLLNHSIEYGVAVAAGLVEFMLELFFLPGMKQLVYISSFGLVSVIFGDALRKTAMFTARSNFNHIIQFYKDKDHVLVTHGVYGYVRHPSYLGWFIWTVGTQIILCNPICLVGYTIAAWKFFRERVIEEEITLLNFFGEDYIDYQRRVPTGLPFIYGYRLEL